MSFHRLSYGIRVCRVRNIEHAIKCVQAEAIVVDATKVFGAGTFVAASTSIADSVDSTFRNFTFVEMRDIRWNVVNQPMNPMVWGIQIFDNQYKAFGILRYVQEFQRGADIWSFARKPFG